MTSLARVVIDWAGPAVVGRAVTVLYYSVSEGGAPPMAAIKTAFEAGASSSIASGTVLSYPSSGDVIDDTTGHLSGVWSAGTTAPTTCTGSGNPAAGVGACIGWSTGGIVSGTKGPRKLRGRTFLVPLGGNAYDGSGTLQALSLSGLEATAQGLMDAGPLGIWHRPTTVGGTDGNSYGVIAHRVRDKVAFLSSRRD